MSAPPSSSPLHLAALAVLFATEYGPFAITLSVLAWIFVNCLS